MWTKERIQGLLIDQTEANAHLEYKAADALAKTDGKKTDISKDVSAFANSDGGTLIYGIRENALHRPEIIDPVDSSIFTKEWLEQVINQNISPKIHGILITPIKVESENPTGALYAIEILKGQTAHQAADKRYYRRYNFQSVPMDDWEIKDVINRQQKTLAIVRFRPKFNREFQLDFHPKRGVSFEFDIIAMNNGIKAITLLDFSMITTPEVAKRFIPVLPHIHKYHEAYFNNEERLTAQINHQDIVLSKQRMPILSETFRRIGEIAIWSDFFIDNMEVEFHISTDDNRFTEVLRGKEIIEEGR